MAEPKERSSAATGLLVLRVSARAGRPERPAVPAPTAGLAPLFLQTAKRAAGGAPGFAFLPGLSRGLGRRLVRLLASPKPTPKCPWSESGSSSRSRSRPAGTESVTS
jgi:hypothetical protein